MFLVSILLQGITDVGILSLKALPGTILMPLVSTLSYYYFFFEEKKSCFYYEAP